MGKAAGMAVPTPDTRHRNDRIASQSLNNFEFKINEAKVVNNSNSINGSGARVLYNDKKSNKRALRC